MLNKILISFFISFNLSAQINNEKIDYDKYQKNQFKNEFVRDSVFKVLTLLKDEILKTALDEKRIIIEKTIVLLQTQIDETILKDIQNEFEYIRKNPSYSEAPKLLLFRIKRREGIKLYDEINTLYKNLAIEVKKSEKGIELNQALIEFANSRIGSNAPPFFLKDINKKIISLGQFENKGYVLIDFWASWCAPCRQDFPFLKEMYSKYKDKGLNIISISRDEKIDSWKNAIVKDNIEFWTHISIKENNSDIEKKYLEVAAERLHFEQAENNADEFLAKQLDLF